MRITLWKGYHSTDLLRLIEKTWVQNELLILCPPFLQDFSFMSQLPEGDLEFVGDWDNSIRSIKRSSVLAPVYPAEPVLGVFTSGTVSGVPRLILYSKKNVESSIKAILSVFKDTTIRSVFCYPQPFHTFGLTLGYVMSYLYRLELVMGTGRYSRLFHEKWIQQKETEGLITLGTPTHFYDLIHYVKSSGRLPKPSYSAIIGGAKVSPALWKDMRNILGIRKPSIGYGATEASPGIAHHPPGQEPQEEGEIGYPFDHLKVNLVAEKGLEFSGSSLCLGIIERDQIEFPSKVLIKDDVRRREDGMWVYHGRTELILNRGGQKFPLEVMESAVRRILGIDALCVSIPSERLGEDLGVLIVPPFGTGLSVHREKVHQVLCEEFHCGFSLENFKTVQHLPINESSKIDRKKAVQILKSGFPLNVRDLQDWVPHRAPMVWIEEVTWVNAEEGECRVMLPAEIRPSWMIEWIAQGYAFVRAAQVLKGLVRPSAKPKRAFLVAIKDARFEYQKNPRIFDGIQSLSVKVRHVRELGPLALVEGKVFLPDSVELLARAQLKVYAE